MSIDVASELQRTFGERVCARRKRLGWSQAILAEKLEMHQPDVCDLEKGRHAPTLETVEKVAGILGVPAKSLLD